jgi:hypothetical protein
MKLTDPDLADTEFVGVDWDLEKSEQHRLQQTMEWEGANAVEAPAEILGAVSEVDSGETSFTIVPERTSRNADGTGRSYNIGSGIVDITTDKTFRSGDTSASVRTYRSDYQNPWLDVTMSLPDLGPDGSAFTYGLQFRTNGSAERPSVLDQIALDIDSALVDKGYVITETGIDEETGEETTTENLDSDNAFVVAVRDVTRSVVEFLSSLLGFGRG